MERTVKHLLMSVMVLCVVIAPQAMAQRDSTSPFEELMDNSRPAEYIAPPPPVDPVPEGKATPPVSSQAEAAAPMASSFGNSESQWGQYQAPDYEDGLTSVGACCETCGHGANCQDMWAVDQHVTAWGRSKTRRIPISGIGSFEMIDGVSTFVANRTVTTRSLTFDVAGGYGAAVRRYWCPGRENRDLYLEASYFGLNTWRERRAVNATGDLFTNLGVTTAGYGNLFSAFTDADLGPTSGVGGFDRARSQEVYYESRIHNAEVNLRLIPRPRADRIVLHPNGRWRRECQPGIHGSYLLGLRYFSLSEQFNFLSTGRIDIYNNFTGNIVNTINTQGTYDVDTSNDLLGLQFGMDLMYRRCLWRWGAEAKISPCVNFARQTSRVVTNAFTAGDPFATEDLNELRFAGSDEVALVGEISVAGYYDILPNLTLRASWDMMWVVGVALGAEQLLFQTDPAPRINTNGRVFYQGISLGLVWNR